MSQNVNGAVIYSDTIEASARAQIERMMFQSTRPRGTWFNGIEELYGQEQEYAASRAALYARLLNEQEEA
jgi:hypothetical protein